MKKVFKLIDFILCPSCRNHNFRVYRKYISCKICHKNYPIINNVLILLKKPQQQKIINIWNNKKEYQRYHKPLTIPRISKLVNKLTNENSISLDVGCGEGIYQKDFKGKVISFDIIPYFVKKAQKKYGNKNRIFLVADANEIPFRSNVFDLSFSSQVIEHLPKIKTNKFLKNMIRISQRYVMIDTPNDSNFFIRNLRRLIYPSKYYHEDPHLYHHQLMNKKIFGIFGFKTHACIGYVSRNKFKFGFLWDIYDFIVWYIPDLGGNLIALYKKINFKTIS